MCDRRIDDSPRQAIAGPVRVPVSGEESGVVAFLDLHNV